MALDGKNLFFGPGLFVIVALLIAIFGLLKPKFGRALNAAQFLFTALFVFYASPWPVHWIGSALLEQAHSLARNAPVPDCEHSFPVVIVLGGGMHSADLPSIAAQERLLRAADLLKELAAKGQSRSVILTGGPTLRGSDASEATAAEAMLRRTLTPEEFSFHKFYREGRSFNTHENAVYSAELAHGEHLAMDAVLVTSPFHMPRSAAAFKKLGFNVCALSTPEPEMKKALSFDNAIGTFMLINEIIGGVVYRLRGWG